MRKLFHLPPKETITYEGKKTRGGNSTKKSCVTMRYSATAYWYVPFQSMMKPDACRDTTILTTNCEYLLELRLPRRWDSRLLWQHVAFEPTFTRYSKLPILYWPPSPWQPFTSMRNALFIVPLIVLSSQFPTEVGLIVMRLGTSKISSLECTSFGSGSVWAFGPGTTSSGSCASSGSTPLDARQLMPLQASVKTRVLSG